MNRFKKIALSLLCGGILTSPVTAAEDINRVWVEFKPMGAETVKAALLKAGAEIHYRFDEFNAFAVSIPSQAIKGLEHNPNILMIEEDPKRYPSAQTVPYGIDAVQAREVWDNNRDGVIDAGSPNGSGITVCIIDSGLNVNHEDFAGVNIIGGYPSGWNVDQCGHGTHVAGTITAANNNLGVVGVNPGTSSLYLVKVFSGVDCGWSYSSDLINAAQRCEAAGAKVINMSLGGPLKSRTEDRAFNSLDSKSGILSFAAAGNDGNNSKSYPASYSSVVSVAAVDSNNQVAFFSQQNNQVELAAPGVGVLSTTGYGYASWNGTSMATPHASGVAALTWSADPSRSNAEIRNALTQTALDLGAPGRDNAYGYGLVQAYDAWQLLGGNSSGNNLAPIAAFTYSCSELSCSFDASSSSDSDGSISNYQWDFGDGNSANGSVINYNFSTAGSYPVTLTVTDDKGAVDTELKMIAIAISGGDTTAPVISNVTSAATKGTSFEVRWDTDEPANSVITFSCCGTYSDPALITSHAMDFRGTKGALYEFTLTSTDAAGNSTTAGPFFHQN